MELLSIKRELLVNSVSDVKGLTKDAILREHNNVFTGLGYIGNYKIELTEGAVPNQDASRTVPVALRNDLKKIIHEMEQKGHIAKVDEPTDWVSSVVYVKKRNGQPRVCLDPRELNKHVKIPKLCLPTIDDVTSRLAKAQVFTVLDDLLVTGAGNTHEEALTDHDRNLIALLQRCRERNFKLNKDKFVFKQTEVEVLWSYLDF